MPITLRIVSWNLRTFGVPVVPDDALDYIATIIVNDLNPDIVCLQEIQVSSSGSGNIGDAISGEITSQLDKLWVRLTTMQPAAGWQYTLSGCNNSDRAKSMSDAYAFFWKGTPMGQSHANAPYAITLLQTPRILRQNKMGGDKFPGRRPGLVTFDLAPSASAPPIAFNLISWHAPTPCNSYGKTKHTTSSGRAINALATLTDIGGGLWQYHRGDGINAYVFEDAYALPKIDTIVLGDFNFRMDLSQSADVYKNLTKNYQPCVSTLTNTVYTTYSPDPYKPFTGSSSYDNLFILRQRQGFRPCLVFANNSGCVDFIANAARAYNAVQPWTLLQMQEAWYVCYQDGYKRQYARPGVSDHLPVWADFDVDQTSPGNTHIKATSNFLNNGLFHALFGVQVTGPLGVVFFDAQAAQHRQQFVTFLQANITQANFPNIRYNILSAMIDFFVTDPQNKAIAEYFLKNPILDPFQDNRWAGMVNAYLLGITTGRPIFVDELLLVAVCFNMVITHWSYENSVCTPTLVNPHGATARQVYQSGDSYFFYQP